MEFADSIQVSVLKSECWMWGVEWGVIIGLDCDLQCRVVDILTLTLKLVPSRSLLIERLITVLNVERFFPFPGYDVLDHFGFAVNH